MTTKERQECPLHGPSSTVVLFEGAKVVAQIAAQKCDCKDSCFGINGQMTGIAIETYAEWSRSRPESNETA